MAFFNLKGFNKQINKANQFMSERITGVEGTKLDNEFTDMERRTDLFNQLVEDLQINTKEYLQPNPTVRAKMAAVKGISKLSGQAKASTYPQPEGTLGDCMNGYGRKLQDYDNGSIFAASLIEFGDTMKQMADLKYALDDNVKQNFLEPLHHTQSKDLKEVFHHRKKLQGRKLDFDCKKRKQAPEEEIKQAEDKFAESLQLAQVGMHNLMDGSGIEHISQLTQFAESLLDYHKNCAEMLKVLTDTLYEKTNEASSKPNKDFTPKTLEDLGIERTSDYNIAGHHEKHRPTSSNSSLPVATSNLISTSPGISPAGTPTHHSRNSQHLDDPILNDFIKISPYQRNSANSTKFDRGNVNCEVGAQNYLSPQNWGILDEWIEPNNSSPAFGDSSAWGSNPTPSPRPSPATTPSRGPPVMPSCQALYDFDAESPGELSFKEGDTINLKAKIDENWYEGTLNGRTGYFPTTYVSVLVPLP